MNTLVDKVALEIERRFSELQIQNIYKGQISFLLLKQGKCVGSDIFSVDPGKTYKENFENFASKIQRPLVP